MGDTRPGLSPFDPSDPVEAIADRFRHEIAKASLRLIKSKEYVSASRSDQANGYIAGAMVGALGVITAITQGDTDAELRAELRKNFDYWFDIALSLNQREMLGDVQ